jgi:hypothetical protein
MPPPGAYSLTVSGASPTNVIPILVAPRVDGVANPPKLTPDGTGLYSITGAGFAPAAATKVTFGAAPLGFTGGAPGAGQFNVDGPGQTITFKAPPGATKGAYPILVTVNGVAATTGWVVTLT